MWSDGHGRTDLQNLLGIAHAGWNDRNAISRQSLIWRLYRSHGGKVNRITDGRMGSEVIPGGAKSLRPEPGAEVVMKTR
jgi:hypothetical protein